MSFRATPPGQNAQAQRQTSRYLPLTAISIAMPKPKDLLKTKELEEFLDKHDFSESDEEPINLRMQALKKVNELAKKLIKEDEGKIRRFLSYRLGVYGADIDALCVAPHQVDQANYFIASFVDLLKQQPEVAELGIVEEAFFCVIKIYFDGIELDVLFSRFPSVVLEEILENTKDDILLKNLDKKFAGSLLLNVSQIIDDILLLVPNIDNFRVALRAIKLWAKKHGIYSNVLGYLDAVSLTVLVARTCLLYPNAAPATLVHKFFLVFSKWEWPEPVLLSPNVPLAGFPAAWDPRQNVEDRFHLMPIITPSYPQQNSARNVMSSTRTVMQEEFQNSFAITEKIMGGKATWDILFEPPNFFNKYKHFVAVIVSSSSAEDHLEWGGLVESEMWHLILALESNDRIKLVHINPQKFDPAEPKLGTFSTMWFIGLVFKKTESLKIDLTQDFQDFSGRTWFKTEKESRRIDVKCVKRKHLSTYLPSRIIARSKRNIKPLNSTDDVSLSGPGHNPVH